MRWRQADSEVDESMDDPDGFDFLEWAQQANQDLETAAELAKKARCGRYVTC